MLGFFILILTSAAFSHAFDIPKGLNATDRDQVVRTLGTNVSTKMLDNPYPLGGYSGFEVGMSAEIIDIRDLRRIGCAPGSPGCANLAYSDESEWRFSRFTIGKGLYDDVDIFFHFLMPLGGVNVSDYGGALRWSFYQARFLPINVSVIGHFDQLNYRNRFTNRNVGGELMVGVNVESFAIYFGGGTIHSAGTFIGKDSSGNCNNNCTVDPNDPAVDPNNHTVTNKIVSTHTVIGISAHFENLFAAAEVDRYQDAVYSLKMGLRF